jgi:hypothetical protein
VKEYLATLDDAAFGAATDVEPKFVSPRDPAAQWTGALKGPAFFAYADNYLIDVRFGIILDVEASRAVRQAEVGAARTMLERTEERFGLKPERLAADSAYGSASMLNWLVEEKQITPHIPVIDKSKREDGTFSRQDFRCDDGADTYACSGREEVDDDRHACERRDAAGSRYRSPLTIIAQAMRAILLASAIAATFVGRRASNAASQGRCLVPWILA